MKTMHTPTPDDEKRFEQGKQLMRLMEFGSEYYAVVQYLRFYLGGISSSIESMLSLPEDKVYTIVNDLYLANIILMEEKPVNNSAGEFCQYFTVNEDTSQWRTKNYVKQKQKDSNV